MRSRLLNIFQPFNSMVWAMTALMLIFGGWGIYFVEYQFERLVFLYIWGMIFVDRAQFFSRDGEPPPLPESPSKDDSESVDSSYSGGMNVSGALKSIYKSCIAFSRKYTSLFSLVEMTF